MRIAISHNEQCLGAYERDRVFSPQYRLKVDLREQLPQLLVSGHFTMEEAETLSDYVARCEEVNRCLDELAALLAKSRTPEEAVFYGTAQKDRANLKVQNLTGRLGDGPSRAEQARTVIGNALKRAGS